MNKLIFISLFTIFTALLWSETYTFSGDKSFSIMRKGEEVTTIEGNVEIHSEGKSIYAGTVSIRGTENPEFEGAGNVSVFDFEEGWELEASEFNFSPREKILRARGDIRLEDGENSLFIRCQVMTVYEDKKQILMEVGVRLFKDDIICRSQYALYRRDSGLLELTGFPVVYKGEDLYRADRITVNLNTNEISMTGRIEGSLITSQEEAPLEDSRERE